MIDTKALRSRILDLAIQGKLTEQLESDGTAEELLPHGICNKSEGNFSSGSVSFKLPSNWVSCYFEDINSFKSSTTNPLNSPKTLYELYSVPNYPLNKPEILGGESIGSSKQLLQENDILVCKINPRINRVWLVKRHTSYTIIGSSEWIPFRNNTINPQYLCYYFQAPFFRAFMESNLSGVGGSLTRAKPEFVKKYPVLLPPLAEQKRIVERVEEIFRLLDTIDKAQEKYSADSQILKAKLITAGIQGKLTKQLPSDGTAEELYQQIQAEKQMLISEGKIKKEKPLPPISAEEIPFEIPSNWKWVRLKTVLLSASTGPFGSMLHKSDYAEIGVPLVNPADIVNSTVSTQKIKKVAFQKAEEMQNYRLFKGNIVIGRRGEMGRAAIITETEEGFLCGTGCFFIVPSEGLFAPYFIRLLQTNEIRERLRQGSVGSTMDNLNHSILESLPIPLPPLAEQKRIAETLEKVLGAIS